MDDDIATVGTANLDNRSLALNFELTAIVRDSGVCAEIKAMLEKDFYSSVRESLEDYNKNRWGSKCYATLPG